MSYLNIEFPDCIAMGAVGGPGWFTDVTANQGGWEQRNQVWSYAKQAYDISTAVKSVEDYRLVLAHFNEMRGRVHSFPFKDFLDYEVAEEEGVLVITEDPDVFQLAKRYGDLNPYLRKITRPVAPQIYNDGVLMAGGYTLDLETGLISFAGTVGNITWAGEFRVPVRYGVDRLPGQVVNSNGTSLFVQATSIGLMEVRE